MNRKIPIIDLCREYSYMKNDIDAAIQRCLEHQRWIMGPEVKDLEDKAAVYLGVRHCIGVSSGTDALVLALRALALQRSGKEYFDRTDEIITTPFTFTATGDAILRAGATPVFVDIDPNTCNIDPLKITEYLSSPHSQVVGIVPVHLYGLTCEMEAIAEIAEKHRLFVLEDVAQGFGGSWEGKKLGSIGDAGAFSFFPSKNLGGFGDGGMVATDDNDLAEMTRQLLKHGGKDKFNVEHIGYNARLDTLQAAVVAAKLKYVDEFNERRRTIAAFYRNGLQSLDRLALPADHTAMPLYKRCHVYHQYTIGVLDGRRDALQEYLRQNGVECMVYYPVPLHKMKVFQGRSRISGNLENAERSSKSVLSLPIEPLLREEEIDTVIDSVKSFFA